MAVVEIEHLTKRYRDRVVVDDVGFTVEEGEILGVLGPNGAGKTTVVECVAGLRAPDRGRIDVLGCDPRRDRARLRRVLGVQLQESELPDKLRVGEAVALWSAFHPDPLDGDALLERWGLADRRDAAYRTLSGGQKQRLAIVLALVGRPRIAILDELTTGLDPYARRDTWAAVEQVRAAGVTVVLVTHFMDEAQRLCDRVAVLDRGRLVALDSPAGLAAAVPEGQRLRFRPSGPFPDALLADLPQVSRLDRRAGAAGCGAVDVRGHGDLLTAVTSALAGRGVVPLDLRLEQAGLDDAVIALTRQVAA